MSEDTLSYEFGKAVARYVHAADSTDGRARRHVTTYANRAARLVSQACEWYGLVLDFDASVASWREQLAEFDAASEARRAAVEAVEVPAVEVAPVEVGTPRHEVHRGAVLAALDHQRLTYDPKADTRDLHTLLVKVGDCPRCDDVAAPAGLIEVESTLTVEAVEVASEVESTLTVEALDLSQLLVSAALFGLSLASTPGPVTVGSVVRHLRANPSLRPYVTDDTQ